jgi:WhiB family transcriptional regulator, redox-sensing transcriptional regulator
MRATTRRPAFNTVHPRWLPAPTTENWNWQLRGSCLGYPSEVFFPDDKRGQLLRHLEDQAKEICRDCPVLSKCRDYALTTPEPYGVWGAMTAIERAKLLARIRRI